MSLLKAVRLRNVSKFAENLPQSEIALFDSAGAPVPMPQLGGLLTCNSAIGTVGKSVTNAEPPAGTLVVIKFVNGNNVVPTISFNGGTARTINLAGAPPTAAEITIAANGVGLFYWDGSALHQVGVLS